jgi:hypothetical protein
MVDRYELRMKFPLGDRDFSLKSSHEAGKMLDELNVMAKSYGKEVYRHVEGEKSWLEFKLDDGRVFYIKFVKGDAQ